MLKRSTEAIALFSRARRMATDSGQRPPLSDFCLSRRMEADWAVEVGADLPSIDVPWEGFVDLRRNPDAVVDIEEAIGYSALRQALIALNSSDSPVFTSKCDVWTLAASKIDPDEFGAQAADATTGCASYIDMVLRDRERLSSFDFQERQVRDLALQMRKHIVSNG